MKEAERLLKGGDVALAGAASNPRFIEALAGCGLELYYLQTCSGLSVGRRTALIAMVLEEQDALRNVRPLSARGAEVLQRQLYQHLEDNVEKIRSHWERRQEAAERHAHALDEQQAMQQARSIAEEERAQRYRAQDEAAAQRRRERSQSRDAKWKACILRGMELEAERIADQKASLLAREERSNHCRHRLEEARASQRSLSQERLRYVDDTARWVAEDAKRRSQQKADTLDRMFERQVRHVSNSRLQSELQAQQRDTRREREHEALRLARMREYGRYQKSMELEDERAKFLECKQMQSMFQERIQHLASLEG